MLPFSGRHRLCPGLRPVDFRTHRTLNRGKLGLIALPILLTLNVACGPSDADVAQAAEESISNLASIAVANLECSLTEAFSGGGDSLAVMERNSTRMENLTGTLELETDASNREKIKVIDEMNNLSQDWEKELEEIGCSVSEP